MLKMLYSCTSMKRLLCLTLLLLVVIISAKYWTVNFDNQQATIFKLPPHPLNETLEYESSLCLSSNTHIQPLHHSNMQCPQKPIVTVQQLGRLGNQMYEYISVWAIAKETGHEPYVPSCIIQNLGNVFHNLTVPPLSYLAYCTIDNYPVPVQADMIDHFNDNMLLPHYAQLPKYIAPLLSEVRQIFQFKDNIIVESQRLLNSASRGMNNITYVGVHVRRTDYIPYLKRKYNVSAVKPDYFLRHMNIYRNKYQRVLFVVLSDDPKWCERELHGDDVVVIKTNSPVQDMAIMSICNHSIIDYGSYGMWGAILSGGDTFVYNLTNSHDPAYKMASLLPNWHIVT